MNARGHLSSETIDLLLLSALPDDDAGAARAHLDACAACQARWQALNEDTKKFEQFVFARTLPAIEARVEQGRQGRGIFERLRFAVLVPAIGLAAAAVFSVVTASGPGTQNEDELYIGLKGGTPSLEIVALRGETQFTVARGAVLKPKDRLRFVVNPAGASYLLIASQDGAGAFSVYHPFGASQSVRLEQPAAQRLELPGAVELDDTLGVERLVAVLSDAPVSAAELEAAMRANPTSPQLPGARVLSWDFQKAP